MCNFFECSYFSRPCWRLPGAWKWLNSVSGLEDRFSFCWMSAPRQSLLISQLHPILITWRGQAIRYPFVSDINYGEVLHLLQVNRTKSKRHASRADAFFVKTQCYSEYWLTINTFNYLTKYSVDKAHSQQSEIQLFTCNATQLIYLWMFDRDPWELPAWMINNRFVGLL